VARVDVMGGRPPEYRVMVDPQRLAALRLSLSQVTDALAKNNLVEPAGMLDQDHHWYLTVVDGRVHSIPDIENLTVPNDANQPVPIGDFAKVSRGPEPAFDVVTADGVSAVLMNIYAQPNASTLDIANGVNSTLAQLQKTIPADVQKKYFYDQSLFVRNSVDSVWEAIVFGLILSVVVLYLFLRNWGMTLVATVVIPVTVLFTILAMKLCGQSFNLMTLGGIAAAIGLIIDDAIVVVEAIYVRVAAGADRVKAVRDGIGEIFTPLLGSTLTPVVVFIPLAFLTGISGVFFRALAITMVVGMLTSLLLALTLTPSLALWFMPARRDLAAEKSAQRQSRDGGFILRHIVSAYEWIVQTALNYRWHTLAICPLLLVIAALLCRRLKSDFLPAMDEGGFVIDFIAPPGTSLSETNRQILQAEKILKNTPEVESFSCRIGSALGVHLVEPNTGDFLVKLKPDRKRGTDAVIADVRGQFNKALPDIDWDFPGILTDLIGDLISWSDDPIEIKLFSNDTDYLNDTAGDIEDAIGKIPGVVDTNSVVYTGPSISLRVRAADAQRLGLDAKTIAANVRTAMLGQTASTVLEGDRVINIRVQDDPASIDRVDKLRDLPLRAAGGAIVPLSAVCDVIELPPQSELERDDLRQMTVVSARLQNRDLGSAMRDIQKALAADQQIPQGTIEFGGLYELQQDSFKNLLVVLVMAVVLVFAVAVIEFRSFTAPIAIVFGAVLAMFGIILALVITGTAVSIVVYLGAIIGVGIVHKNGILMLDYVEHLQRQGIELRQALIQAGRRRLRPVLMTSLTAALGMLPLAYGIGSGAEMLRPMAIAIIGAVVTSVLLSLVATPTLYFVLVGMGRETATTDRR
jgi:CzcA family heavy metal efflux pump